MTPSNADKTLVDLLDISCHNDVTSDANLRWKPVQLSHVFPHFWKFAAERQNVFFNRLNGLSTPWSLDPVIQTYKFTNAYRVTDRVSQFLIRNVIYKGEQSAREIFFRTLLFKIFNNISTWTALEEEFGTIESSNFDIERYDTFLSERRATGRTIFSAAYIMPSGSGGYECSRKHRSYLGLLSTMLKDHAYDKIAESASMHAAFSIIREYPMMGDFLSYQYITDINYSTLTDHSENQFVVPGPGALRGISKCFVDLAGLTEIDIIRLMTERQNTEFNAFGINFKNLFGRELQYIDVQNLFCEFDKYCRVAYPELSAASGRIRIKQRFTPSSGVIQYYFPPKWGLLPDYSLHLDQTQLTLW